MLKQIKQRIKAFIASSIPSSSAEDRSQINQIQLINQYTLMKNLMKPEEMPKLKDVGFKVYSQFEEDGLLLYIFSVIGTVNKKVLEICAGDGIECMAANLIINHGWNGLLYEGDPNAVEKGRRFFKQHKATWLFPPVFKQAWITKENINELLAENDFTGDIDLLSLDIDGNDYYIMEAMEIAKPRVIICETHNVIPTDISATIPYNPTFDRMNDLDPDFMGVSLLAMKNLLDSKGYRLVGAHRYGFNAIFIRKEIGQEFFPEVSVASVHDNGYTSFRKEAWNKVEGLPWVKV
jgi:mRNA-degrading endonuclease HigB of HigAB toxin-antitoxin module